MAFFILCIECSLRLHIALTKEWKKLLKQSTEPAFLLDFL